MNNEKVSDLTAHINFKIEHSNLVNLDNHDKDTKKNNEDVKNTYGFFKKPSNEDIFEQQIVEDIIKTEPYEHKKIETPYVKPSEQDAQTTENEIIKENDEFLQTASEFNKIDAAATKQKEVDFYDKLSDDVQDVTDSRQAIDDAPKTEYILIDDELFCDNDTKEIKNLVGIITMETDVNDILFDHEPVDVSPNIPWAPDPTGVFDVLLPKNIGKNKAIKKNLENFNQN